MSLCARDHFGLKPEPEIEKIGDNRIFKAGSGSISIMPKVPVYDPYLLNRNYPELSKNYINVFICGSLEEIKSILRDKLKNLSEIQDGSFEPSIFIRGVNYNDRTTGGNMNTIEKIINQVVKAIEVADARGALTPEPSKDRVPSIG